MKHTLEIDGERYEVLYDGYSTLRSMYDVDIEVEEVICLSTGCEVPDTVVTNNDAAMEELEKHFRDNYDPTPYE